MRLSKAVGINNASSNLIFSLSAISLSVHQYYTYPIASMIASMIASLNNCLYYIVQSFCSIWAGSGLILLYLLSTCFLPPAPACSEHPQSQANKARVSGVFACVCRVQSTCVSRLLSRYHVNVFPSFRLLSSVSSSLALFSPRSPLLVASPLLLLSPHFNTCQWFTVMPWSNQTHQCIPLWYS